MHRKHCRRPQRNSFKQNKDEVEAAKAVPPAEQREASAGTAAVIDVGTAINEGFNLQFSFGKLLEGLELQESDQQIVTERSEAVKKLLQNAIKEAMGGLKDKLEGIQKEMAEVAPKATKKKENWKRSERCCCASCSASTSYST